MDRPKLQKNNGFFKRVMLGLKYYYGENVKY